jgi:hypothetical protein
VYTAICLEVPLFLDSMPAHLLFVLFWSPISTMNGALFWLAKMTRWIYLQALDGTSHWPHHRGIDFTYDSSPKPEGCLLLWFRKSDLSDPVVRQVLNLEPLDSNDNSNDYDDDKIVLLTGRLLGDEYTVYHVQRVLTNKMHVAVVVIQSKSQCGPWHWENMDHSLG